MKVAIYVRVSTSDQSVDMQLQDLNRYVQARGFEVFQIYQDVGISGTKESRPALNELMADAFKRKFKTVLVWKFDRFARSQKHLVTALEQFMEYGIDFISFKENLDTTTSMGRAMFGMISVMAQLERDLIQERVVAGIKAAKANGKILGRPKVHIDQTEKVMALVGIKSFRAIGRELGMSVSTVLRIYNAEMAKVYGPSPK